MPIKTILPKVDVYESLGEIQGALARNGARKIMVDYDDQGKPVITFGLQTPRWMLCPAAGQYARRMAAFARQKVRAP